MTQLFHSRRTAAVAGLMACVSFVFVSAIALAQPGQERGGFGGFVQSADPRVQNRTYHFTDTDEQLPYCVFVSSRVSADRPAPLVVSLHGLGVGPGFMCQGTVLDRAEEGGYILVAPMGYNVGGWYGSPVITMGGGRGGAGAAPPPPENLAELSEKDVMNVLAMIREEFNVDDGRTYLMGHSMGGAGTLFLGAKHADQWAALGPIAPAAFMMNNDRGGILARIRDAGVPVMVVQGGMDELVPEANTRQWVDTMAELGVEHEYVFAPEAGHGGDIIDIGVENLFEFFARHRRE